MTQLQHAADFSRDDSPAQKRAKLEKLLAQGRDDSGAAADLLAGLLGLDQPEESATPMDPKRKRGQVLAALIDQLAGLARRKSGADGIRGCAVERSHLARTANADCRAHAGAAGPAPHHAPPGFPAALGRPTARHHHGAQSARPARAHALVDHVTGGKALPQALLEQIVERTDGVPLFVEELTKAVLERNVTMIGRLRPAGLPSRPRCRRR